MELEVSQCFGMGTEGPESSHAVWRFPEETPSPFFHSFNLPPSESMPIWSPAPIPPENEATTLTRWQLSSEWQWRLRVPMHVKYFRTENRIVSRARHRSLGLSHFRPWRRLGLVIWDSWRMCTVGLCYFPSWGPGLDPPNPDGSVFEVGHEKPDYGPRWLALVGELV